jgi:glycosyltransferase involved in cell wall biosynthesis
VLGEAMASGTPVVATDVPGIADVVRSGESALLCGTSPAELREGIETLLADPGLRKRLSVAARHAAEEVSLERVVELELDAIEAARAARRR